MNIIKNAPDWQPSLKRGLPIIQVTTMPISYKLVNSKKKKKKKK